MDTAVGDLKVRGKEVDLANIGIDRNYDSNTSSLRQILTQVRALHVCLGTKETLSVQERVSWVGEELETASCQPKPRDSSPTNR